MYLPKHFEEPGVEAMHRLIRANPLATLVTLAAGEPDANHVPLQLIADGSPFGCLHGHLARANPLWRTHPLEIDVLAVFQGADAYITPSWYASKQATGKAVPTWNYAVVHARGRLRVIDDANWLRRQLAALTAQHEAAFAEPWAIDDAPPDYIEQMIAAVVGIEIVITRLSGKRKVSQNQPAENRAGVIEGLQASGTEKGAAMAALVAEQTARIRQ